MYARQLSHCVVESTVYRKSDNQTAWYSVQPHTYFIETGSYCGDLRADDHYLICGAVLSIMLRIVSDLSLLNVVPVHIFVAFSED